MKILFLDIASHDGLLVLCRDGAVVASEAVDHRIQDDELVLCLETLLKKVRWKQSDLTDIACVVGPGGFTSLRVGVAFANALAWSLKIPTAGVHLSDLYAARIPDPLSTQRVPSPKGSPLGFGATLPRGGREHSFLWLHSTKKHELFVRGFGTYRKKWPEPAHVLLGEIPENIYWIGELLPAHIRSSWKEMPLKSIEKVLPQFLQKQTYGVAILTPWYGRKG